MRKIGLEDGKVQWESAKLTRRHEEDLVVQLQAGYVIVTTSGSVSAVDSVTGLTLWEGAAPQGVRFAEGLVTDAYVVAVDVSDGLGDGDSTAYFYDHRNASGVIPRNGGARVLGQLSDRRAFLVVDGALLVQTGSNIMGWTK